eukprot:COSAG02_NODE_4890_length_4859_cov_15.448529_3_plen_73_part_00
MGRSVPLSLVVEAVSSPDGRIVPYCVHGCYAFGITLEKVDLDLRGAHHDIRSFRALRLDSLGINSFGIELSR